MISQKNKIVDKSQQNCRATNLFDQDTECKDTLHTHTMWNSLQSEKTTLRDQTCISVKGEKQKEKKEK